MRRGSPIRKCVGCGRRRDEIELIRIVNNKNEISIDPGISLPGRGVYLCPNKECLKEARKKNELSKALKTKLSDDLYQELVEEIADVTM